MATTLPAINGRRDSVLLNTPGLTPKTPPHPVTPFSQLNTPSTRGTYTKAQPLTHSDSTDSRPMYVPQDGGMENLSGWPSVPIASSSTTHLLTPHSPTSNQSYPGSRPQAASPETPTMNSHSHPMLGAAFSPRSNDPQKYTPSLENKSYQRPHNEPERSNYSSVQLTPTSSPIYPRSPSRYQNSDSPVSAVDDSPTYYSPHAHRIITTPLLASAHIVDHSISSGSTLYEGVNSGGAPFQTQVSDLGPNVPPLLPAFEDATKPPQTPQRRTHLATSPQKSRMRGFSDASTTWGAEEAAEDVFRIRTPTTKESSQTVASTSRTSTPTGERALLQTPPPRAPGGEMKRIRAEREAEERGRRQENEQRRPEYLQRVRSKKDLSVAVPEVEAAEHHAHGLGLGIAFSPVKGRRIQLVRPASPSTSSLGSPASAQFPQATNAMSNLTLQWLHSSPDTPMEERPQLLDDSEKETKKRKRLAAFMDSSVPRKSPLKPLEIQGMGRVAVHPHDITETFITPTKSAKKKGARKAASSSAVKRLTVFGLEAREDPLRSSKSPTPAFDLNGVDGDIPEWPDTANPWDSESKSGGRRDDVERQRLRQLEKFFERITDDEDSDDPERGHPNADPSPSSPPPSRMGRGKSVVLYPEPFRDSRLIRSVPTHDDPGDARTALFSRQRVRRLSPRKRDHDFEEEDDEGVINCMCGKQDTDKPMVQCDSCHTWSHQSCMGIMDESELEAEWYCHNCDQRLHGEREPTFTLTSESPLPRTTDPIKFPNVPALTASPIFLPSPRQSSAVHVLPVTPKPTAGSSSLASMSKYRTPAWDVGDIVGSATRHTPKTPDASRPRDMRMYSTPKFFTETETTSNGLLDPFDPTTTPSRGFQYGTPFQDTVSSNSRWNYLGQPPTTPIPRPSTVPRPQPNQDSSLGDISEVNKTSMTAFRPMFFRPPDTQRTDESRRTTSSASFSASRQGESALFEALNLDSPTPTLSARSEWTGTNELSPASNNFKGKAKDITPVVVSNESAIRTGSGSDEDN